MVSIATGKQFHRKNMDPAHSFPRSARVKSINSRRKMGLWDFTLHLNLMSQGRYWILTIPHNDFLPYQPQSVQFIRGQLERGEGTGYLHWQLVVAFKNKCRRAAVKKLFGDTCHAELSRSDAADSYVWKEETRVDGTQFELGSKAFKRNSPADWAAILDSAKRGRVDDIPPDILLRWVFSERVIFFCAEHN